MSRWLETCTLVQVTQVRDEYDVPHEQTTTRTVRCNPFSMGDQAFYGAAQAGVHPIATIQLHKCEWLGERTVIYHGSTLHVERANTSSPDFVVLTLTERSGERVPTK